MTTTQTFQIRAAIWRYHGSGAWHFITLSKLQSAEIKLLAHGSKSAWSSVHVIATIGRSSWKTSIFPDNKIGAYLLPIKAEVRKKEKIAAGEMITLTLEITV
jgi:hypothetical protein